MSLPSPTLKAKIATFAAGFLDSPEQDSVPLGAQVDGKNGFLSQIGPAQGGGVRAILRKRDGCQLLNSTAIASGKKVEIREYTRDDDDSVLVAVCNGVAYAWDGATFNAISGGTGFTSEAPVRFEQLQNNLVITDGTKQLRFDGTSCKDIGQTRTTTAPTLATGAAVGVTGTYQGYWVGYDPVMDHETSPSDVSAAVTFANQKRVWTRPAHALPAEYTKWRVYAQRTDTSEQNYYRAGEQDIGTATITETLSDAARRDLGVGPFDHSNDPPPGVFAWISSWKGFAIAALPDDSDYFASKQGDFQSWHPKHRFPVRRNEALRGGNPFQNRTFLLQSDSKTFELRGDRVPFTLVELHSAFGRTCPAAYVEGPNHFYAWDKEKGPYRSDLETWEPLADQKIEAFRATVNRAFLNDIRAYHHAADSLIIFAVPTAVDRRRTLLCYNYALDCWHPPVTGFEYASLAQFTDEDGITGSYFGDYWGRVYKLFEGDVDGVPSGTTSATITAATSGSITAAAAAFYTTGDALAGMPAAVRSPSGAWQWVRIQSNNGTVLTLDTTNGPSLSPVPDPTSGTWTVIVGGIEWYAWLGILDFQTGDKKKVGRLGFIRGAVTSATHVLELLARFNNEAAIGKTWSISLPSTGGVWGVSLWGSATWGSGSGRRGVSFRLSRTFHAVQIGFRNYYPNQPMLVTALHVGADLLKRRIVSRG